jgi:hypothetical protein
VQGRLRFDPLSFTIETRCAHCAASIQIETDSKLDYRVLQQDADPLVFVPLVDFSKLDDPSIIDAF